jgi:hypothetical protein
MTYYKIKDIKNPIYSFMLKQCKGIKWIEEVLFNVKKMQL